MKQKPLVEMMAQAYATESRRLNPLSQGWDELDTKTQNHVLACMTEVARVIGYFESRGMVMLVDIPPKKELAGPQMRPTDMGAPEITDEVMKEAVIKGFTGIMCGECGSPNTVRTGACLKCHSCFAETECG